MAIPGTGQLAVVTAENPVADQGAKRRGDRPAVFNGEIGDAAAGIEVVGGTDRPGRADIEAPPTTATQWSLRLAHRQRQIGINFTQEEPGPHVPIEQERVFSHPPQARLECQGLFQHRGTVAEDAITECADGLLQPSGQVLQALANQLVIIAPECVAGDVAAFGVGQGGPGFLRGGGKMIHAYGNDANGAGDQLRRAAALAAVTVHPVHIPVVAGGQPAGEPALCLIQFNIGNAEGLETQFQGPFAEPLDERLQFG